MKIKHNAISRPTLNAKPECIGSFPQHGEALAHAQKKCGYGKFWIESLKQNSKGKWIEFAYESC